MTEFLILEGFCTLRMPGFINEILNLILFLMQRFRVDLLGDS